MVYATVQLYLICLIKNPYNIGNITKCAGFLLSSCNSEPFKGPIVCFEFISLLCISSGSDSRWKEHIVSSPSEHQPKPQPTPPRNDRRNLQAYIFPRSILHIIDIRIWRYRNMYSKTHRRDSCMKGLGSARRRSWGSLPTHLQVVCKQLQRVNKI